MKPNYQSNKWSIKYSPNMMTRSLNNQRFLTTKLFEIHEEKKVHSPKSFISLSQLI